MKLARCIPFACAPVMVVSTLFQSRDASAQVNVETLRADLRKKPAMASVEGSFTGRAGNIESIVVGGGAIGAARVGKNGFLGSTQGDYTRYGQEVRVSKSFIHLRYHYELLDWLYPEAFAQQQTDKFQRLQLRELAGVGPRFVLVDEEELRVATGTAYMFEYERISVPLGASDDPETTAHRWSNYVTATWVPDSRVRFMGTLYAQPRWDEFSDARFLLEGALTTQVFKRLAVKVLFTLRHDTRPPTDVKMTDAEVKNAFVLQF
jgi:putative salt-induced outer membrane protein YdiY